MEQGIQYLLFSFEGRVAVIAAPKSIANDIVVISFNSPSKLRTTHVELNGMSLAGRHLVWIGGRLHLALRLFGDNKSRFIVVDLDSLKTREATPEELYQEFAIDGFPGGLVFDNDFAFFEKLADSQRLVVSEVMPRIPSSVVLPPDVVFPPISNIGLFAANKEMLVFHMGSENSSSGPDAKTSFHILDRGTGRWNSINAPGGASLVRAFGPWLVVQVRDVRDKFEPSPGSALRRQERSATGPPYDLAAEGFRLYQPGMLYLYHVPTGKRIVEETGQGDSEVLWIEGDKVLYRCDRILYEARIEGTSLKDKRKLIERNFIADVHWVFYGPPSDPPPDPPWPAFKEYEK